MASGSDLCRGKIFINSDEGLGFSESFYFDTGDRSVARTKLMTIMKWRAGLLAGDCNIVYASISRLDSEKDALSVDLASVVSTPIELIASSTVVDATPVVADETGNGASNLDVIERGLLVRPFTFAGVGRNHLLRGIRDTWIEAQALLFLPDFTANYATVQATAVVTATFTPEEVLGNLMTAIQNATVAIKLTAPDTYTTINYDSIEYRRVSKHDCGAGYSLSKGRKAHTV